MKKAMKILGRVGFILLLISPALIIQLASQSRLVIHLNTLVHIYLPLYLFTLIILKVLGIVYPPLPGIVFTLASIPLVGWKVAYLVDLVGSTLGATCAFFLGKKYGYTFLNRMIGKTLADKIMKIKLKKKNQIEASLFLKFASGGLFSDGLAWGASLIGFRYIPFTIGYAISHVVLTLPVFFFVSASISFNSWVVIATVSALAWLAIYKFKGRYFE